MKRLALSVVLLLMSSASSTLAQSYTCILRNTCKAPPCEFMTELKRAKASVRALAKIAAPDSTSDAAMTRFGVQLLEDAAKRAREYASKCPAWDSAKAPIVGPAEPECQVGVRDASGKIWAPGTLDDAQKASSTCSEVVEAEYRRQEIRQQQCEARAKDGRPMTVARRRANDLAAAQEKVDFLRNSLLRYLSSCKPDAKTARELSSLGLDSLMKDGKAARDEWQAQRVSGASAVAGAR